MSYNPFIHENIKEYKQYMNPLEEYRIGCAKYISKRTGMSEVESRAYVDQVLKDSSIKNPKIEYYEREDNFDKFKKTSTLLNYLNKSKKDKDVIAPSFTAYLNANRLESFQKKFILNNLQKRTAAKKKMFEAKSEGRTDDFIYYNVLQKILKIFNNSLSGAYAITSTVLYNPSAHYALTSITRSVASIGNAVTEMLVSGNRYYKDFDAAINSITMTISFVNLEKIKRVMDKYKLHYPTVDETMSTILYSSRLYWKSEKLESEIYEYLKTLTDLERACFVYVNDFYHIRKYNDKFARLLLGSLSKKCEGNYENNDYSILKEVDEFVLNTAYHICSRELEGKKVDFKKMKFTREMDILVSTVKNMDKMLHMTEDFMKAFFTTDITPINIADVKDMLRRSIILSDTDSTCGTYGEYVRWYYGADIISPEATALSASIMMINGEVIGHYLKVFSANMNVEEKVRDILAMKNEFYWTTMTPANVSKHYYAGVKIQEGVVIANLDRELKGVHLHANKIPIELKNKNLKLIDHIQRVLNKNRKLNVYNILSYVATIETSLLERLYNLDPYPLLKSSIKPEDAYKKEGEESKYRYHTFWNEVFSDKYGRMHEPRYSTYELPVVLKGKAKIQNFRNSNNGSLDVKDKFFLSMNRLFKDGMSTLSLPEDMLDANGIPEELKDIIDYRRCVELAMKPFYIVLETIGFYKNPELLIRDMIE